MRGEVFSRNRGGVIFHCREEIPDIIDHFNQDQIEDMTMAYDVFISYRRDKGAQIARNLQQALEKLGLRVFLIWRN